MERFTFVSEVVHVSSIDGLDPLIATLARWDAAGWEIAECAFCSDDGAWRVRFTRSVAYEVPSSAGEPA